MKLNKPSRKNEHMHLFMLYNNECSGNTGCTMANTVAACGGEKTDGALKCGVLSLLPCKK